MPFAGDQHLVQAFAAGTGTGVGDAMATLETAEALTVLPETTEALRRASCRARR